MRKLFNRRPSAALVVGLLALIVALNGSAIANETATIARAISGSSIKKNSIPGNRLKNNTVTGKQVKESSLGTVPSATNALNAGHASSADNATHAGSADNATHAGSADNATHAASADNATHAGSADATNGVKLVKIFYTTTGVDTNPTVIFHDGGLKLTATCPDGGNAGTTTVVASPDGDNNEIDGAVTSSSATAGFEDYNFDATDSQDIENFGTTGGYDAAGHLTFATRTGSVVSIVYQFDSNDSFGNDPGHKACDFTGIAQVG